MNRSWVLQGPFGRGSFKTSSCRLEWQPRRLAAPPACFYHGGWVPVPRTMTEDEDLEHYTSDAGPREIPQCRRGWVTGSLKARAYPQPLTGPGRGKG